MRRGIFFFSVLTVKISSKLMEESIQQLIDKFLRNELTEAEAAALKIWLQLPEHRVHLEKEIQLHHLINAKTESFDSSAAFAQHQMKLLGEKQMKIAKPSRWYRYAAAAIILMTLTVALYWGNKALFNKDQNQLAAEQLIQPGTDKAILTLADGRKVILDDKSAAIRLDGSHQIVNQGNGLISYEQMNSPVALNAYNTIETPKGGTYQLILSDGTKVWLNSASKLHYPIQFTSNERLVELEGEAYFEVMKDAGRKFLVKSKAQQIEVLGTKFNVNCYHDEAAESTVLLEGSVKILAGKQTKMLKPDQEIVNANGKLQLRNVADAQDAIAWKNGYFQFDDEHIESVMRKLARWYDIEVEFAGKVGTKKFNGIISRNKTLNSALKIMEATENVSFKIEGRKLIVKT